MTHSDWLREALRREAAGMEMPSSMPATVGRSIRRRRGGVLLSALSITAVTLFGLTQLVENVGRDGGTDVSDGRPGDRDLRAGVTLGGIQTTDPRVVGRGRDFGVAWELVLSRAPGGPCLELQIERQPKNCHELGEGWAPGFDVDVGYASKQERAYVFGTVPDSSNGVSISLRGGGQWAGLFFEGPEGDRRDYFVRVFPSAEVFGTIQQEEGLPRLEFRVSRKRNGAVTGFTIPRKDYLTQLPYEGLPGDTSVLFTDPIGDTFTGEPFDVVLRTDDDGVCLRIEDAETCESREQMGELRVVTAQRVGAGVVIAGLVGPQVDQLAIESSEGDRWPQQLQSVRQAGLGHRFFVLEVQAPFDGRVVVTLDDGSRQTVPLEAD